MIDMNLVRMVDDEPAVPITVCSDSILVNIRIKSLGTGRIHCVPIAYSLFSEGMRYLPCPGFEPGDRIAFDFRTYRDRDLEAWFNDDHEVGLLDYLEGRVACLQEPACNIETEPQETPSEPLTACDDTQEAPEDLPEAEGPEDADDGLRGGVMGCAAAELRTVLIETMRRQDRAMTVKEIAAILNSDTVDARTRIATVLADMEGKGLVKRGSYVQSQSPGRKSVTTWVVA